VTHVLRVTQEFFPRPSGPAKQAREVALRLARVGIETTILTCQLGPGTPVVETLAAGVRVERFPARGPFLHSYISPRLLRAVHTMKYDVLHVHGWRNVISDVSILLGGRRSRPVVLQAHGTAAGPYGIVSGLSRQPYILYDAVLRPVVPLRADVVIAATSVERRECVAYGIPEEKCIAIPPGIEDAAFVRRRPRRIMHASRLLYVGRISRDRRLELLVRAVSTLVQRRVPVSLRIVGPSAEGATFSRPGYRQELAKLVTRLGLNDSITFVGERTGRDLRTEYAAADIFVYAAQYESFGQALLEAAAAGMPLISTPAGVAVDLVRAAETGFLVEADPEAMADALESLILSPRRTLEMGLAAQQAARRDYSWPRLIERYVEMYRSLI
jgi:glycosyltransferase involved in cell wall biosynthesis